MSLTPFPPPCSKQQSKRDRANRTANSKANAIKQTTQQPQLAPHTSNHEWAQAVKSLKKGGLIIISTEKLRAWSPVM
jgi:ribosomal protein L18